MLNKHFRFIFRFSLSHNFFFSPNLFPKSFPQKQEKKEKKEKKWVRIKKNKESN